MDPSTATTSNSITVISDLNDDCLLEIVGYLGLTDLCAMADVCSRFRQISQRHFASLKFKNRTLNIECSEARTGRLWMKIPFDRSQIMCTTLFEHDSLDEKLLRTSKFLRNFGSLISSIQIRGGHQRDQTENEHKYERIFDMISAYCGEKLVELKVSYCDITNEIAITMRPLLQHLRKLLIFNGEFHNFETMLSPWLPELRELYFVHVYKHSSTMNFRDIRRRSFPKLELISLRGISNVENNDIEEFLVLNSQLKAIGITDCPNIDGSNFEFIGTHVPGIETVEIDKVCTTNGTSYRYFGKWNNLTTLTLCATQRYGVDHNNVHIHEALQSSVLYALHAANIQLQHLHVHGYLSFLITEQLVDAILKFKRLRSLKFAYVLNLKPSHILGMCKQLTELLSLELRSNKILITAENLLDIVTYAQKLEELYYLEGQAQAYTVLNEYRLREKKKISEHTFMKKYGLRVRVRGNALSKFFVLYQNRNGEVSRRSFNVPTTTTCVDAYMKMVEIVGQRREKTRLLIKLDPIHPVAENIPKKLSREYSDIVRIVTLENEIPIFFLSDYLYY